MHNSLTAHSLATDGPPTPFPRRSFLRAIVCAPLAAVLVACGRDGQTTAPLPSVTFDVFPTGLGRGYPLGTLVGADNSATGVGTGDIAPNFRLQLDDKQGIYLADLVGRPLFINFWTTWCGPCRLEMPEIVNHATTQSDLLVIAVNVQEQLEPIAAFASDFNMTMPIVRDVDAEIRDLYRVRGMPTSVFIDRDGRVAAYWEGALAPSRLDELITAIV